MQLHTKKPPLENIGQQSISDLLLPGVEVEPAAGWINKCVPKKGKGYGVSQYQSGIGLGTMTERTDKGQKGTKPWGY